MKLKHVIIVLFFACFSTRSWGQYKYVQKLGSIATIALPDTPQIIDKDGIKIYVSKYQGVVFMAEVGDVSGGLRDLFRKNQIDSSYSSYIKGVLGSIKGDLFYKNKLILNGHEAVEFGYKADIKGQKIFAYNHAVILSDTILMCGIWASDSLSKDDKNLKPFFDGFKTKNKKELSHAAVVRKAGKIIGYLIALSIPVFLGLGVIFVIKKIVYKKNK